MFNILNVFTELNPLNDKYDNRILIIQSYTVILSQSFQPYSRQTLFQASETS